MLDLCDKMIDYEEGLLSHPEIIELFQVLIDESLVWRLQGFYGQTAKALIREGLCHA